MASHFRTDIEGLRAVAVASVVLYHAHVPGFSGGFIGVDVFFVISGFLITGLLLEECRAKGRIDILAFWARRARRLLPNALLTLTAIFIAGSLLLPLVYQSSVQHDVLAALGYVANYRFSARALDYFQFGMAHSPVLHFWSLSVEEQFYIALPLLFAVLAFSARSIRVSLWLVLLLSFAAMLFWMTKSQPRAFFDTEARIWQLAAGGLLAAYGARAERLPEGLRAALAWVGLAMIAVCVTLYSDALIYPGWYALAPTLGAALVLAGGDAGAFAPRTLLGRTPMQWLGARSYSIYLWHWPLLVFVPLLVPGVPHAELLAIVLCVPIAAAVYAYVENPIRRSGIDARNVWPTFRRAGLACASLAAVVILVPLIAGTGTVERTAMLQRLEAAKADNPRKDGCAVDAPPCYYGAASGTHRVALFGDSHAHHLFDGIEASAAANGWKMQLWVRGGCAPIEAALTNAVGRVDPECTGWREAVIQRLIAEKPDLVLIATSTAAVMKLSDAASGEKLPPDVSLARWRDGFATVLRRLSAAGLRVVVVRDTPRNQKRRGSECLGSQPETECVTPRPQALTPDAPDVEVAGALNLETVDLTDRICGPRVCPAVRDGMLVYRGDDDHLTATFSLTLAPAFDLLFMGTETAAIPGQ